MYFFIYSKNKRAKTVDIKYNKENNLKKANFAEREGRKAVNLTAS